MFLALVDAVAHPLPVLGHLHRKLFGLTQRGERERGGLRELLLGGDGGHQVVSAGIPWEEDGERLRICFSITKYAKNREPGMSEY